MSKRSGRKGKSQRDSFRCKQTYFSSGAITRPIHIIGLRPCSITKVLTGADYPNKSCGPRGGVTQRTGMQKGLPEGQR